MHVWRNFVQTEFASKHSGYGLTHTFMNRNRTAHTAGRCCSAIHSPFTSTHAKDIPGPCGGERPEQSYCWNQRSAYRCYRPPRWRQPHISLGLVDSSEHSHFGAIRREVDGALPGNRKCPDSPVRQLESANRAKDRFDHQAYRRTDSLRTAVTGEDGASRTYVMLKPAALFRHSNRPRTVNWDGVKVTRASGPDVF